MRMLRLAALAVFAAQVGCSREGSDVGTAASGQTPTSPLPYEMQDFIIPGSESGMLLAGTLTLPRAGCPCPTAILVQGAGSHDRDYTIFGHKPFLVLADHLGRNGIATLRFDERGIGESVGDPRGATTEDLAQDVSVWLEFLREQPMVDPGRTGIIGHSEGGTIGSLVGAEPGDIAFLIMVGSPGLPGLEYNLQYEASMGRAMGLPEETIRSRAAIQERVLDIVLNEGEPGREEERLRAIYSEMVPPIPDEQLERGISRLLSPWFRFNLNHDPTATLREVSAPVLAVFGEKDVHVPPDRNREALLSVLDTGSGRDRVVVLPGLNHFMQTAVTGFPEEYSDIQETIAPAALDLILQWIRTHTGPNPVRSCTILHAAEGDVVLGASNEDWEDPLTRLWIIPGLNGDHGWIKFGFAGGFPQAGMNDEGLFWDATGSPFLAMPMSEANKSFFDGPLMVKVMEEAGSVEEAREIFGSYYCEDQYRAQYLVGDALGASMIVEGDSILTKAVKSSTGPRTWWGTLLGLP